MSIFNHLNYKDFLKELLAGMPKAGHGQMRQLSQHLKVHTTLMSQIMNGPKHFTLEQACAVSTFFAMTHLESDYFLTLVEWERAGTKLLKDRLMLRIDDIKTKATSLDARLTKDIVLSEQIKAEFYSNWYYSGIRLMTSIDQYNTPTTIATRLDLPKTLVVQILDFLLSSGLVVSEHSKYSMGPSRTHLSSDSPFQVNHHRSWRLKNLARAQMLGPDELMYTAPFTVSKQDANHIRNDLLAIIEKVTNTVINSEAEEGFCLGIDLCKF
jgi:uncharacterized protein (TIGR02147 family)